MTLEDIEDLVASLPVDGKADQDEQSYNFKVRINPRYKKEDLEESAENDQLEESFLPGKHSIYVRSMGCTHSVSDGEYLAGLLAQSGYPIVDRAEQADLWILNSCTVKNPAEDHFRNEIEKGKKLGKKLVVSGCVPQGEPKLAYLKDISVIGVQQIDKVVQVVEETLKGNVVRFMAIKKDGKRKTGGASLHMPKIRRNPLIEIIAINTGCLNECTYCKTKHARGNLGSYHPQDIVHRAKSAFEDGVKELWITSEDTGAYGRDIGTNLPELLDQLVAIIPKGCMLRLGMTNPPYILEHIEAMARTLSHPRVYAFLHIPVQAGSDQVLADMKRQYCIDDFCHIVDFLREKVPGITIATDIICGFPTETEEDFEQTMWLLRKYNFPVLFINQFYPRPGTPAARMKRIPTTDVKKRTRMVSDYFNSYSPYDTRIGQRYTVLVSEESTDKKHYVGHNKFYEQILVCKSKCTPGQSIEVEIVNYGKHHMMAEPVRPTWPAMNHSWLGAHFGFTTCVVLLASTLVYRIYKRLA